jgi:tRNA nucleotidyltransferase/poly(A) polymerase
MILTTYSKESYLVGGCVRDSLLGIKPKDFDFVTDIPYDKLDDIFTEAGWAVSRTGENFLVLNIAKDGVQFEIANFRCDDIDSDGRRPNSVKIGNIYEDSLRRDFYINSLYMRLSDGEIVDPTGKGLEDIKTKTIRFVGRAEDRIKNDYLRVFRFYRFIKKGFTPAKKDLKKVREMFAEAYNNTTPERVREEIEKMVL